MEDDSTAPRSTLRSTTYNKGSTFCIHKGVELLGILYSYARGSSGGGLKAATRKIHSPQESLSPNQRAAPESKSSSRYQ
nr:unnamed protein product [Callosobruchus chinensis]